MEASGRDKQGGPLPECQTMCLQKSYTFCGLPKGMNLELSDEGRLATRSCGVGRGIGFVGPLHCSADGAAHFEVDVVELEASRTQTVAIGVCTKTPAPDTKLVANTARELGSGYYLIGYDLPRFFVHGKEVAKVNAKEWRPLKQLTVGDRLGLLFERSEMRISVFVNGERKVHLTVPGPSLPPVDKLWGVVDVHGTLKSVRLRPSSFPGADQRNEKKRACANADADDRGSVAQPSTSADLETSRKALRRSVSDLPSPARAAHRRLASTQELILPVEAATPIATENASGVDDLPTILRSSSDRVVAADAATVGSRALANQAVSAPPPSPAPPCDTRISSMKRRRTNDVRHTCGCVVHLVCHAQNGDTQAQPRSSPSSSSASSSIVHVPGAEFVIGRNTQLCHLALDSTAVPNMVSRRHAIIEPFGSSAVMITDCSSLNGTYVNGRRISRETLRDGDVVVIGNPAQSPLEFTFTVSMPSAK